MFKIGLIIFLTIFIIPFNAIALDDDYCQMHRNKIIGIMAGYEKPLIIQILLTDPCGRKTGFDLQTDIVEENIPCSSYFEDYYGGDIPPVRVLYTNPTINGNYSVNIYSPTSTHFNLSISLEDSNGKYKDIEFTGILFAGVIKEYIIKYDSSSVDLCTVTPIEEEVLSSTSKIHPHHWNLNWYNWIKGHMEEREWIAQCAERISVLCTIGNLKDSQGNSHSVDEISPETLLLNNVLPPHPWKFKGEEKTAIILKSGDNRHLRARKGFKEWHRTGRFFKDYQDPIMLVKFNKVKAMETLPGMIPGKEYEVIVSGKLKDGKPFKGSAMVTITEWKAKHGWKWNHPGWLNCDKDVDHWWNKERDIEKWWEKIKRHHKPKLEPASKGSRK